MNEVTVLNELGQPVQRDAHEYAREIGHAVTIDNGDGSTTVYHEDGSEETFYAEVDE